MSLRQPPPAWPPLPAGPITAGGQAGESGKMDPLRCSPAQGCGAAVAGVQGGPAARAEATNARAGCIVGSAPTPSSPAL